MAYEQKISISQGQSLIISVRLKQRLQLLYMALPEVCDTVENALNSNPILERDEKSVAADNPFSDISYSQLDSMRPTPEGENDNAPKTAQDNSFAAADFFSARKSTDSSDWNPFENKAADESLSDDLMFQLVDFPLTEQQHTICQYIIESLDSRGYFTEEIHSVASRFGVSDFDCEQMLYVIQSLEPAGIAARTLEECLLLQLAVSKDFNSYTIKIVKEYLPLLAKNNIASIAKHLHLSVGDAGLYCNIVKSLTPVPTRGYYTGADNYYIVPDAMVTADNQGFIIYMNDNIVPPLVLNNEYIRMAKESKDKEVTSYLHKNITAAKNLIADLENREATLYRLLKCLVEIQPQYFRDGKTLVPMRMSDLAEKLDLNVSTISRAVHGKYIVCAGGTVSLKSLFSSGFVGSGTSDASLSSVVVKRKIVALISAEKPDAPLSDDALKEIFAKQGINLSRRTIAKYRGEMGIASSFNRKAKF